MSQHLPEHDPRSGCEDEGIRERQVTATMDRAEPDEDDPDSGPGRTWE